MVLLGWTDEEIIRMQLAVVLLWWTDKVIIRMHLVAVLLGWTDDVIIRMVHLAALLFCWIEEVIIKMDLVAEYYFGSQRQHLSGQMEAVIWTELAAVLINWTDDI